MENETEDRQDIIEQGETSTCSEDAVKTENERTIEGEYGSEDHDDLENKDPNENIEQENGTEVDKSEKRLTEEESSCDVNRKFTIVHDEPMMDNEGSTIDDEGSTMDDEGSTRECDFSDVSSLMLLRGTVNELERALRDSRVLLKTRDEEITGLRKEVEKGREQIHKEQMKWQRKSAAVEERAREIQELKRKLRDSEKANEELQERIKEFESPCSESNDVFACCSSMKELLEVKTELAKKDETLAEIRKNNCEHPGGGKAIVAAGEGWKTGGTSQPNAKESDQHNQLKLKFLRDAFFYFMIDFHSDEQIKAILAVLAYGDQREDVILQAYRMRQRGKKFSVKEVSSRGLSFLHEEI